MPWPGCGLRPGPIAVRPAAGPSPRRHRSGPAGQGSACTVPPGAGAAGIVVDALKAAEPPARGWLDRAVAGLARDARPVAAAGFSAPDRPGLSFGNWLPSCGIAVAGCCVAAASPAAAPLVRPAAAAPLAAAPGPAQDCSVAGAGVRSGLAAAVIGPPAGEPAAAAAAPGLRSIATVHLFGAAAPWPLPAQLGGLGPAPGSVGRLSSAGGPRPGGSRL